MKRKILSAMVMIAGSCSAWVSASYAGELTLVSWGGAYGKSQQEAFVKPFSAKTSHKVMVEDYSGGLAQIRAQVKTGNVTWDVVDLELQDALRACDEGLLQPLNVKDLEPAADGSPAAGDFVAGAVSGCTIGSVMWANIIAFDVSRFKNAQPKSVRDFFDVKNFPGKRGMRKSPKANLEWALLADGVAAEEIYKTLSTPAGVERAFKKLDTLKPHIVWWETGAQAPQLLADGEVVMTSAYNGRIQDAIGRDRKAFKIIWDGQIPVFETFAIVKGSKNQTVAREFIKFATAPQNLAAQTRFISYGPLRKSAVTLVDEAIKPQLPTLPQNMKTAIPINGEWWADNIDDLNQRFAVWLNK